MELWRIERGQSLRTEAGAVPVAVSYLLHPEQETLPDGTKVVTKAYCLQYPKPGQRLWAEEYFPTYNALVAKYGNVLPLNGWKPVG